MRALYAPSCRDTSSMVAQYNIKATGHVAKLRRDIDV